MLYLKQQSRSLFSVYIQSILKPWKLKISLYRQTFNAWGSQLLDFIKANYQQYPNLIVGTADCGLAQIRFYERNGFVKYAIRKDFFIENYEQPIYENGTLLKDMIMLRYTLDS